MPTRNAPFCTRASASCPGMSVCDTHSSLRLSHLRLAIARPRALVGRLAWNPFWSAAGPHDLLLDPPAGFLTHDHRVSPRAERKKHGCKQTQNAGTARKGLVAQRHGVGGVDGEGQRLTADAGGSGQQL